MDIQNNQQRYCENCICENCINHNSVEIEGYENYRIFKDGRIWSKIGKGKFLKPYQMSNGYVGVRLSNNGKVKNKRLHRLIAEYYIINPNNLPEVDHIDRNKLNNDISNLRWVSSKINCNNRKLPSTKKKIISGHRFINKNRNIWDVSVKRLGRRCFKSKIDALCYKFIMLLKIKSNII